MSIRRLLFHRRLSKGKNHEHEESAVAKGGQAS